jgi:hypothetical protein
MVPVSRAAYTFAPIERYAAVPEVSSLTASDPLLVGAKLQPFETMPAAFNCAAPLSSANRASSFAYVVAVT